jgi:hypothetical protein
VVRALLLACTIAALASGSSAAAQKPELKTYRAAGPGHVLRAVGAEGRTLTLEDGSVWSVDPRTQFKAASWQPDALITVVATKEDPDFNYVINNEDVDDWTFAVLVSER